MDSRKKTLDVLFYSDIELFLKNINKYDDFIQDKILCNYCNEPINLDNICTILIKQDNFIFLCNKKSCYNNYLQLQRDEQ